MSGSHRLSVFKSFRKIFYLSIGDIVAKTISFLVFIYLARTLGVQAYGVLEFALSIIVYLVLLCDAGLELWGTREVARGKVVANLAARIVAIRLLFAFIVFLCLQLVLTLPAFPTFPHLRLLLAVFGLILFAQAIDLRWVFMGQEQMHHVATGLVIAQFVFATAIFILVQEPSDVLWIPLFQFLGNLSMALYLIYRFAKAGNKLQLRVSISDFQSMLVPALPLGISRALALLSYNIDALLLGLMVGSSAVGWYSAAYRPVTVFLVVATTFYLGLFPVLSRAYKENLDAFLLLVRKSQQLSAILAVPIGVFGVFLAWPLVDLLYGSTYRDSIPVLQILACSASLVFLRGTFRQALCAAGHQGRDLGIAALAGGANVALNLVLIPIYGMVGAALATVASEIIWLGIITHAFKTRVARSRLLPPLVIPMLAGAGMVASFLLTQAWIWQFQALLAGAIYTGILTLFHHRVALSRGEA